MFAILATQENMPKIAEVETIRTHDRNYIERYYVNSQKDWYVVRGYVSLRGNVHDWSIFPAEYFRRYYDYDPEKIQTDWAQAVRKERP